MAGLADRDRKRASEQDQHACDQPGSDDERRQEHDPPLNIRDRQKSHYSEIVPDSLPAPDANYSSGADYVVADCAPPAQSSGASNGAPAAGVQSVTLDRTRLTARYHRLLSVTGRITPATAGVRVELVDAAGTVLGHGTTTADGLGTMPPANPSRSVPRRVGATAWVWVWPPCVWVWVCPCS